VGDLATGAIERAALLADRLPEREEALVRGALALERGTLDGIDILREVVRRHPDDAEAWYLLGDLYFHLGGQALVPPGESDRAFARASALDPRFAPAYLHRISAALRSAPDSARVTRLIEIYGRLAPGTRTLRNFRLVSAVAFGDRAARVRALAALDTTSAPLPFVAQDLSNARFLEAKSEVLRMALDDPHPFLPGFAAQTLFGTLLFRGRLEEARGLSHHPAIVKRRGELLYEAHVRGFPVPDDELATALTLATADTADVFGILYAGVFAAERGRWGNHAIALARLRSIERDAVQSADSTEARLAGGVALALEGVEAWRRDGRLGEARSALDQARTAVTGHFREGTANRIIRWWLAELLIQSGEPREAARYFRALASGDAFVTDPVASYRLGQLHEQLGETREAREEYEYFLTAWRDPDPGLRSWGEQAREALVRLEGSRRG
jgi:tetratricopeptide (TPR) repeat protein